MTVTAAAMTNGAHHTQKAAASAQNVGTKDADDLATAQTQAQARVKNADSDDNAVKNDPFGKSTSTVQAALLKLQASRIHSS